MTQNLPKPITSNSPSLASPPVEHVGDEPGDHADEPGADDEADAPFEVAHRAARNQAVAARHKMIGPANISQNPNNGAPTIVGSLIRTSP